MAAEIAFTVSADIVVCRDLPSWTGHCGVLRPGSIRGIPDKEILRVRSGMNDDSRFWLPDATEERNRPDGILAGLNGLRTGMEEK